MGTGGKGHPCLSCGACCAYFRVEFYWREASDETRGGIPVELSTDLNSFKRCMQGTERKQGNRCVALEGRVGGRVACTIYDVRPRACRAFGASYENGNKNPRCDEARAAHGLKALTPADFAPHSNAAKPGVRGPRPHP